MKRRSTPCPSCGAPVEFHLGAAMVTVCEFCSTAVGRGDKAVEDYGKVADLIQTNSPIHLGTTGRFRGKPFEVIGRVQYAHAAGGFWDEWYLRLPGERVGWLAEAQGKLAFLFERPARRKSPFPDQPSLRPGGRVKLGKNELTVTETGVATARSAAGEIPWDFRPGAEHRYADLQGTPPWVATLEYRDDDVHCYVGQNVALDDLHLSKPDWQGGDEDVIQVAAVKLSCPHCGGPLELHAPDETLRVGCPHCSSLLDASHGKLQLFQTLEPRELHPYIPLGATGALFGQQYTAVGYMERFATWQGRTFPWTEYLLYSPNVGYRWLVCNDRHWSFVETISPHEVNVFYDHVIYKKKKYRVYDRGTATVRAVIGEFYWKVTKGETVQTGDYIAPPEMISIERSASSSVDERNVSLGRYVELEVIREAFGLRDYLKPWGIGVIQPAPKFPRGLWISWLAFAVCLFLIHWIGSASTSVGQTAPDGWMLFYAILFVSVIPAGILAYKYSFEVNRWKDSDYSPYASDD